MKSLFTIQADETLDQDTIEQFCRFGIRETTRVEYKREFPNDLAKSISSFANTQGGIILIGVDADSENKPLLPLTGMPFVGQPEERVYQTCANAIYPPLFPSVWVVRFEDQSQQSPDRVILVVRVVQGESAHSVDGRRGIYVRTGNVNTPFERATVDEMMELLGRRKESAEFQRKLLSQSHERFTFFFDQYVSQKQRETLDTLRPLIWSLLQRSPLIRIQLVPVFPRKLVSTISGLRTTLRETPVWRIAGTRSDPFPPTSREQTAQDAVFKLNQTAILELGEFTEHGLLSFTYNDFQDAKQILSNQPQPAVGLDYHGIVFNSLAMLCFGVLTYEALGFHGLCEFHFEATRVRGRRLAAQWDVFGDQSPDDEIRFAIRATPSELKNGLLEHYLSLMTRVRNAFGLEMSTQHAEQLEGLATKSMQMNFRPKT